MVGMLLTCLGILSLFFLYTLIKDLKDRRPRLNRPKLVVAFFIGVLTDFLDTLGIGSFAPTIMLFNATKFLDDDRKLPGTLNTAHVIPTMVETFIFIGVVKVSPITLITLVISATIGAFVGSKRVIKASERRIQLIMGSTLIVTALLMAVRHIGWIDLLGKGNEATGLVGMSLVIGIIGNFILGLLMTVGVGIYAPCMAMLYLLGLSPLATYPIMMASSAGLMPVAGVKFIKSAHYSPEGTIGILIGGVLGVFMAVPLIRSLNLYVLTWVVIGIILYSGGVMLYKYRKA